MPSVKDYPFPASGLSAFGSAEQSAFKRSVFVAQLERAIDRKGAWQDPLEESALTVVEGNFKMQNEAAQACINLFAQARADLAAQQSAGDAAAARVQSIGVCSAYRSPEYDLGLWEQYFPDYYNQTADHRAGLDGGPHGDAAVTSLAHYIGLYKAMPGFSNHSGGIAFDATTVEGSDTLGASKSQSDRWLKAWLHGWLVANAATFGFQPLSTEAWHWDYRP